VKLPWSRHRNDPEQWLVSELQRDRPEPDGVLVASVLDRIAAAAPTRSRRATLRPRLALSVGLSLLMLVALSAVGGLGVAAAASKNVVAAVAKAASPPPPPAPPAPAPAKAHDEGKGNAKQEDSHGDKAAKAPKDEHADEDDDSPAKDQYKPGKGCGDQNHVHFREGECKKLK
jgi:hypothetical protein